MGFIVGFLIGLALYQVTRRWHPLLGLLVDLLLDVLVILVGAWTGWHWLIVAAVLLALLDVANCYWRMRRTHPKGEDVPKRVLKTDTCHACHIAIRLVPVGDHYMWIGPNGDAHCGTGSHHPALHKYQTATEPTMLGRQSKDIRL